MNNRFKNLGPSKLGSLIFEGVKWFEPLARPLLALSLAGLISACSVATPFRTVAARSGQSAPEAAVVVITEATLASNSEQRATFWQGVNLVQKELPTQPGLIGYSLRQELLGNRVWTMTIWQTETDVRRFTNSTAHIEAMQSGQAALLDLRFARFRHDPRLPAPTWDEAMRALELTGKRY